MVITNDSLVRFSNTVNVPSFALATRCCHSTHTAGTQSHRSVKKFKTQCEKYIDGDVRFMTCETAWTRCKHTVNVRSESSSTVTVTVDCVDVDVDRVAKPCYYVYEDSVCSKE